MEILANVLPQQSLFLRRVFVGRTGEWVTVDLRKKYTSHSGQRCSEHLIAPNRAEPRLYTDPDAASSFSSK